MYQLYGHCWNWKQVYLIWLIIYKIHIFSVKVILSNNQYFTAVIMIKYNVI